MTFIIYLGALVAFLGWFLFMIYVSIGFIGLPMDLFKWVAPFSPARVAGMTWRFCQWREQDLGT